ncbi:hypothetical protein H257_18672, partial [Aphanomyces astaci]
APRAPQQLWHLTCSRWGLLGRIPRCAADIAAYESMLRCFIYPSLTLGPAVPSRRRLATNSFLKAASDEL